MATDWTLDLLLPPDIVQLKTDKSFAIRREHFEADEIVFREGDRGDWLYVVVEGEVDVEPAAAPRLLRAADRNAQPVGRIPRRRA